MPATAYPHIELNAKGQPCLDGTRTKVVDIVLDRLAYHWDADEIQRQHPHLTLSQIYSALAYYYDHQTGVDGDIAERMRDADEFFARRPEPPFMARLRALKNQPR